MPNNSIIHVQSIDVAVTQHGGDDYICLTDMAKVALMRAEQPM